MRRMRMPAVPGTSGLRRPSAGCGSRSRRGITAAAAAVLVSTVLASSGPLPAGASKAANPPHEFAALRMGTEFRIVLYHPDRNFALRASMAAFDRIEELEDIFSDYRERSEAMRLCRTAVGAPQKVSADLMRVLDASLLFSRLSGGAFDVTVGPVTLLWRRARKEKRPPDPSELALARAHSGYAKVVLNRETGTVLLRQSAMRLDFGGIAKGYAADEALAILRSRGIASALVDAGGDIAAGAAPPGARGWKIAIRDPVAAGNPKPRFLLVKEAGVATSGDSFQFLEVAGKRYSHIIDPADGQGTEEVASVTAIARDGMTADALATSLSLLPLEWGLRLAESVEGASAEITRRSPEGLKRIATRNFPKTGP